MKLLFNILVLLSTLYLPCQAQALLTVREAVDIALANNYDIKLSANNLAVAKENAIKNENIKTPNKTTTEIREAQKKGEDVNYLTM